MSNRALVFLNYYFRIFSKTANYLKKKVILSYKMKIVSNNINLKMKMINGNINQKQVTIYEFILRYWHFIISNKTVYYF